MRCSAVSDKDAFLCAGEGFMIVKPVFLKKGGRFFFFCQDNIEAFGGLSANLYTVMNYVCLYVENVIQLTLSGKQ